VEALIETGQTIVDGLIWLGIYCLPFLIPLGLAVYFLIRLIRKRKAKKQSKQVEEIKPEEV
jgi:cytochrome c biogenesis protein CcdA